MNQSSESKPPQSTSLRKRQTWDCTEWGQKHPPAYRLHLCSHFCGYLVFSTLSPLWDLCANHMTSQPALLWLRSQLCGPTKWKTTHPSAFQRSFSCCCWVFVCFVLLFLLLSLLFMLSFWVYIFLLKKMFLHLMLVSFGMLSACVQSSIFKWMEFIQSADLFLYQTLKSFRIWGNRKHCKSQPLNTFQFAD